MINVNQFFKAIKNILIDIAIAISLYSGLPFRNSYFLHYLRINKLITSSALVSIIILSLLITAFCIPINSGEQYAEASTGTVKSSFLTLNVTSGIASVDLTVKDNNGTFATTPSGSEASFNVVTNNYTGYTLTIEASDDTGNLTSSSNGSGSSSDANTLSSITSTLTESQFNTTANNNKWGYKPSKVNSTNNTSFLPSPTTTATTIDTTSTSNSTANNYSVALGVRADYTKPADTYTKSLTLATVPNPIVYTVAFNKNTTDTVTNLPSTLSSSTSATSITLPSTVPTRTNYSFIGWCLGTATTSNITTDDGVDSCSTTTYNPNGAGTNLNYDIDQTTANDATLWAMWKSSIFYVNVGFIFDSNIISLDILDSSNNIISTLSSSPSEASLVSGETYVISPNYKSNYILDSINVTGDGTLSGYYYTVGKDSAEIQVTSKPIKNEEGSCDNSKLCVKYNGNGLPVNGAYVNNVNYNSSASQQEVTKYSHTSNISDAGVQSGSYSSSLATKDVISIPGASELNVTITYGTENNYDMLYVFQGEYTGTISRNMDQASTGWLYKYMGGDDTTTTVTITIPGDTATFGFYSDSGSNYYGYYAVINGVSTVYSRSAYSGSYATPTTAGSQDFYGWSSTKITGGIGHKSDVEYANESDVKSALPGNEGDTKTLYAVYQQEYDVTFNKNSGVSKIVVLDSDNNTVGTISASGQSLSLLGGDTYIIRPTYATRYAPDTLEKTSGDGTLVKKTGYSSTFTVGAGVASINITGRHIDKPMQNYDCSDLANVGDTSYVYDTRDDEIYLISKLADGKCWMLDNLRLDISQSAILANTTADNTNASTTTLSYLKNGNGTASDKYPNAKINARPARYTASLNMIYFSAPSVTSAGGYSEESYWNKNTIVDSRGPGSGKIGTYYNYCAASAGSYCYGDADYQGATYANATEDICPAGWRMPTGNTDGEYQALYAAYNSNLNDFQSAFSTSFSGRLTGDNGVETAHSQGSNGFFWSSTRLNNYSMHDLDVSLTTIDFKMSTYFPRERDEGKSVRCVAMPINTFAINYDKNTTDNVSNMPSNQSKNIHNDTIAFFGNSTDKIPSRSGYTFAGWGTSGDQGTPMYQFNNNSFTPDEVTVYASDNPETLYAVWQRPQEITINFDNNVSSVKVLDSYGNTVSTIATSGTKISLIEPVTYTIRPTHATGFTTSSINIASGTGKLSGGNADRRFTVGAGATTINVASKAIESIQNYNCSSLAKVGDTDLVYDIRDRETYLIGKLADNNCWMLDNLRLDLGNSTTLANTTTDNTNASASTLNYLKNGGGTTSDKYPTAKINNVAWTGYSRNYYGVPMTVSEGTCDSILNYKCPDYPAKGEWTKDSAVASYGPGSGKIGVYYNYCAASAGSYCYGDNTGHGTSTGDATEDICPAGWRLPTGGENGDYSTLSIAYNSNSVATDRNSIQYNLSTPLSGYFGSVTPEHLDKDGYFWSSGRHDDDAMQRISVDPSEYFSSNTGRNDGVPVRCIKKRPEVAITFNFGPDVSSVTINENTVDADGSSMALESNTYYNVSVGSSDNSKYELDSMTVTSGDATTDGNTLKTGVENSTVNVTVKEKPACVTADTLITLANGEKVRIDELTGDETLQVWDFDTGTYSTAPIVFIEPEEAADYHIIHLFFEDGTDVETSFEHGFFDATENKFVYINEDNPERYIGHQFIIQDGESYKTVELTEIKHETKHTKLYSLTTFKHFNFYSNGMLTIGGGVTGMFNYFDVDPDTMKYDPIKKRADIEQYGLLSYDEFNQIVGEGLISGLGFEAYDGQYLKVSVGKGITTWDGIRALAERYGHFTDNSNSNEDVSEEESGSNEEPLSDSDQLLVQNIREMLGIH